MTTREDDTVSRQPIEWEGEVIATLVETAGGSRHLVPPIVFDTDRKVVLSAVMLQTIGAAHGAHMVEAIESGATVEGFPILRDYSPGDLAALEQKLARVAETLSVDPDPAVIAMMTRGFGE
jgi:hypothetical protein